MAEKIFPYFEEDGNTLSYASESDSADIMGFSLCNFL